ncbi:MAG TPA: hypothetical protein VNQ32_07960 [Steroidobacteraceae bacterium]|nr:hypothetical protein [Steroidobacteraceae bacterium]
MQTMPKPREQSRLDTVLDQLLAGRWPPTAWARIQHQEELPWRFEALACGARKGTWRAYTDGARLAFAVGEFVQSSRRQAAPGVMVRFFDAGACCCAAGIWVLGQSGQWTLREVLD